MEEIIKQKLSELEKTRQDYWNVTPETGEFLNIMAKKFNAKNILELGTSNGYSTIWLALAARELQAQVTTIELFQERIDLAVENFKHCQLDQYIKVIQSKIQDFLDNCDSSFDFVFIDACKHEYLDYFIKLEPLLSDNASIIADNISSHEDKLENYLAYTTHHPCFESVFVPIGEGLILHKKK